MSNICSSLRPSILRDSQAAVKDFNWEMLILEFADRIPTLVLFLKKILPKASEKFVTFIISMILKKRCKEMSLVKKVVSVLLYGNGTSKQVLFVLEIVLVFIMYYKRFITAYNHSWFVCHLKALVL